MMQIENSPLAFFLCIGMNLNNTKYYFWYNSSKIGLFDTAIAVFFFVVVAKYFTLFKYSLTE